MYKAPPPNPRYICPACGAFVPHLTTSNCPTCDVALTIDVSCLMGIMIPILFLVFMSLATIIYGVLGVVSGVLALVMALAVAGGGLGLMIWLIHRYGRLAIKR